MRSRHPSAVSYQLGESSAELPRSQGVAQGARGHARPIPGNGNISDGRTIRPHQPDAARGGLDPANIAEGCVRSTDADFARFLHVALGSASEVEYFALLARDLHFLPDATYETIITDIQEVKRMLSALIARLKADS